MLVALLRVVGFLYILGRRRIKATPRRPVPRSISEAGSGTTRDNVEASVSSTSPITACTATPKRVWPGGAFHMHISTSGPTANPGPIPFSPGGLHPWPLSTPGAAPRHSDPTRSSGLDRAHAIQDRARQSPSRPPRWPGLDRRYHTDRNRWAHP